MKRIYFILWNALYLLQSDATFPGGIGRVGVPTREQLMIYQQILRHDSMNTAALREYDEKLMANSPPLELRRPGSVPRTVAVPHSLQSPQDRATGKLILNQFRSKLYFYLK